LNRLRLKSGQKQKIVDTNLREGKLKKAELDRRELPWPRSHRFVPGAKPIRTKVYTIGAK